MFDPKKIHYWDINKKQFFLFAFDLQQLLLI